MMGILFNKLEPQVRINYRIYHMKVKRKFNQSKRKSVKTKFMALTGPNFVLYFEFNILSLIYSEVLKYA